MAAAVPPGRAGRPQPDPIVRSFLQRSYDYFDFFWRGETVRWYRQNCRGQRSPVYQAFDVPRWSPSSSSPSAVPPAGAGPGLPVEGTVPPRRRPYNTKITRDGSDPAALRQIEDEIRNGTHDIARRVEALGFRLVKVLGKGGEGVAVLFEMNDSGTWRKVVVKYANDEPMTDEMIAMRVSNSCAFPTCLCITSAGLSHSSSPRRADSFAGGLSEWSEPGISCNDVLYGASMPWRPLDHLPREVTGMP